MLNIFNKLSKLKLNIIIILNDFYYFDILFYFINFFLKFFGINKIFVSNNTIKNIVVQEIEKYGLEADLNHIDVTFVTDASFLFDYSKFNGDISKWNTKHFITTSHMFHLSSFNGDISQWDVSNVANMSFMFTYSEFNSDISKWNTKSLENAKNIFIDSPFKQDISHWNLSNVENFGDLHHFLKYFTINENGFQGKNLIKLKHFFKLK